MKKILAILLAALMILSLVACDSGKAEKEITMENIKIGLICLHDENSTYDANFINALKDAQKNLGLKDEQVKIVTNIPEDQECLNKACELADDGCNIIFADSFGHEDFIMQAAQKYPDVQFCHATGTNGKFAGIKNYHNAFASIYEGRYLAGIAAGMKLNEMIAAGKITADKAVIGYVGAWPYAEVKSGYTSFFLGARSVCKTATMKVKYTNSWFDIALEKEAAETLIADGCVLISQHADSEGAPKACEAAGVPNVAYNISTIPMGPNTAIISSKIDWAPYYELCIKSIVEKKDIVADYCGTIATGSVVLTELNTKVAAEGTQEAIDAAKAKIEAGELKVFATDTWTKDGATLTEYIADVNALDDSFKPETNVIHDGYFDESNADSFRSAPYFDFIIDGITELG